MMVLEMYLETLLFGINMSARGRGGASKLPPAQEGRPTRTHPDLA